MSKKQQQLLFNCLNASELKSAVSKKKLIKIWLLNLIVLNLPAKFLQAINKKGLYISVCLFLT